MPDIFLTPKDPSKNLWMDPRKLYRLHDQTVVVYVEETTEPFSKRPNLKVKVADDEAVVSNGDGSFQVRTKAEWPPPEGVEVGVAPKIEYVGDGAFVAAPAGASPKGTRHKLMRIKRSVS